MGSSCISFWQLCLFIGVQIAALQVFGSHEQVRQNAVPAEDMAPSAKDFNPPISLHVPFFREKRIADHDFMRWRRAAAKKQGKAGNLQKGKSIGNSTTQIKARDPQSVASSRKQNSVKNGPASKGKSAFTGRSVGKGNAAKSSNSHQKGKVAKSNNSHQKSKAARSNYSHQKGKVAKSNNSNQKEKSSNNSHSGQKRRVPQKRKTPSKSNPGQKNKLTSPGINETSRVSGKSSNPVNSTTVKSKGRFISYGLNSTSNEKRGRFFGQIIGGMIGGGAGGPVRRPPMTRRCSFASCAEFKVVEKAGHPGFVETVFAIVFGGTQQITVQPGESCYCHVLTCPCLVDSVYPLDTFSGSVYPTQISEPQRLVESCDVAAPCIQPPTCPGPCYKALSDAVNYYRECICYAKGACVCFTNPAAEEPGSVIPMPVPMPIIAAPPMGPMVAPPGGMQVSQVQQVMPGQPMPPPQQARG